MGSCSSFWQLVADAAGTGTSSKGLGWQWLGKGLTQRPPKPGLWWASACLQVRSSSNGSHAQLSRPGRAGSVILPSFCTFVGRKFLFCVVVTHCTSLIFQCAAVYLQWMYYIFLWQLGEKYIVRISHCRKNCSCSLLSTSAHCNLHDQSCTYTYRNCVRNSEVWAPRGKQKLCVETVTGGGVLYRSLHAQQLKYLW